MRTRRDRRFEVVTCDDCGEQVAGDDVQRDPASPKRRELCPLCAADARRRAVLDTRSRR